MGGTVISGHCPDARRVADIKMLNAAVQLYKEETAHLPTNIDDLRTSGVIPIFPTDPVTGTDYLYHRLSPDEYLISTFLDDKSHPVLRDDVIPGNDTYECCLDSYQKESPNQSPRRLQ